MSLQDSRSSQVHSSFRTSLSAVLWLWGLWLCGGCTERGDEPKSALGADGGRNGSPTAEAEPLGLADHQWPLAGEIDTGNRFLSVVDILTQIPQGWRPGTHCSGVLLAPNLVLTAGHCVCKRQERHGPGRESRTVIDASACVKSASVRTAIYIGWSNS